MVALACAEIRCSAALRKKLGSTVEPMAMKNAVASTRPLTRRSAAGWVRKNWTTAPTAAAVMAMQVKRRGPMAPIRSLARSW